MGLYSEISFKKIPICILKSAFLIGLLGTTTLPSCRPFVPNDTSEAQLVGGSAASISQFPGVVYLGSLSCTATRIKKNHFLTAKHCIENASALHITEITVSVGQFLSKLKNYKLQVSKVLLNTSSDLALIQTTGDTFGWAKINLAATHPVELKDEVIMVGYGCSERKTTVPQKLASAKGEQDSALNLAASFTKPVSEEAISEQGLRFLKTTITDVSELGLTIHSAQAKNKEENLRPGLCQGDSGGPLLRKKGKGFEVVAVNSTFTSGVGLSSFARIDKNIKELVTQKWIKALVE